jgi:hypothetical protein
MNQFRDHSYRRAASQPGQIHCCFRMAAAHQDSTLSRPEGKDVSGAAQLIRAGLRIRKETCRHCPVGGADPGADSSPGITETV